MTVEEILAEGIKADLAARYSFKIQAKAALKTLPDAGYAAVPVEPTEEMIEAGMNMGPIGCCNLEPQNVREIYKAMIETGAHKV